MRKVLVLGIMILAIAVPLHSYVTQRDLVGGVIVQTKWPTSTVSWTLNTTFGSNVTGARSLSTVFQASFDTWDALTTMNMNFARGADTTTGVLANDGINVMKLNLSQSDFTNVAGDALGLTVAYVNVANGNIVDADIIFNPGANFSTELVPPADKYDLQSIATHEIGHLLGLDHSGIMSATMFPRVGTGVTATRVLSNDDIAGVSSIYPTASYLTKGSISGTVRLTSNATVYGALVVVVNSSGQPVAHGVSDTRGNYTINGLDPGNYTIYAEPMDSPYYFSDQSVLSRIYPDGTITTAFTTRFR